MTLLETPAIDMNLVDRIIERHGTAPGAAIPILQDLQGTFRYLPVEALRRVCEQTGITPTQISGVSTFYSQFRHRGAGKHLIQVCHGTACHVAGAERVTDSLRRHFGLKGDEDTSADGEFTVERVGCLGCCSLAPVLLIDEETYGHLDSGTAVDALRRFIVDEGKGLHDPERKKARQAEQSDKNGKPAVAEARIGLNSCCMASGSTHTYEALVQAVRQAGAKVTIRSVGCTGMCHRVPIIELVGPAGSSTLYGDSAPRDAMRIIRKHIRPRGLVARGRHYLESALDFFSGASERDVDALAIDPHRGAGAEFLRPQVRIATEYSGVFDPLDLDGYMAHEGYEALKQCLTTRTPEETLEIVRASGLRGRGGAGFPTAQKWEFTRNAPGDVKYILCNGDEGDPGAFMDRMLLEAYPHRIIEGLAIAARVIGAHEAYFYIRAEYRLAVERVEKAILQAEERGLLGDNILGTGFNLKVHIKRGAGAFVCGEETGMIASIEGQRGMPRFRPPYPAHRGLWGRPTNVNNAETFAMIPWIIRRGAEAFAALGTENSRGTKVFALAGRTARGGLIEVPMGTTIREIVEVIGGGIRDGRRFKAVQLGGPSGGCIPARMGDLPIAFDAVQETGAIMGSGGLVVLDDKSCMVDVARFFLDFTQKESCGRCTFCRVGTKRMLEILERLCRGEGKMRDIDELETLGRQITTTSMCGLGKTAPNPILTTIRYFRDEYEAHVRGVCPAGKCEALIQYVVDPDKCIGCSLCAQACPVEGCIPPRPFEAHEIDEALCVRCGACESACPEDAIDIVPRQKG